MESYNRVPLQNINNQNRNNLMNTFLPIDNTKYYSNISNENIDPLQTLKKPIYNEIESVINNNAQLQENNSINNLYIRRQQKNNKSNNSNSISKINTNQLQIDIIPSIPNTTSTINSSNSSVNSSFITSASSIISSSNSSSTDISYSYSKQLSLFTKLKNLVTNKQDDTHTHTHTQTDIDIDCDIYTPSTGNTPKINKSTPITNSNCNSLCIEDIIGKNTFFNDYLTCLFMEEENQNINTTILKSKERGNIIDWIYSRGSNFNLQRSTIYRIIYYFDKVCQLKEINTNHIELIATICLLIAIKWNEKEEKVPSLYKLSRICNKKYTPKNFKDMELKILNILCFKLKIVLPIDFVLYYINIGCIFNDDKLDNHFNLHLNCQSNVYLKKFAIFFLDISCQNNEFYKYLPSIIGFTVIIASRRALKIQPYFNKKLIKLCHYYPKQINDCFMALWHLYRIKFPNDASHAEQLQPKGLDEYECKYNNQCMDID